MRTLIAAAAISSALLAPLPGHPEDGRESALVTPYEPMPQSASSGDAPAAPEGSPPEMQAPPPAPEPQQPQEWEEGPQASAPAGQWVYTDQYGWIWIPYADTYTYAPSSGYGQPYQYVYYPVYGWTWVAAPWVWGWGPWPYFGVVGPVYFGWYAHGWWQYPSHYHYVPAPYTHGFPTAPAPGHGYPSARPTPGVPRGSPAAPVGATPRPFAYPGTPAPSFRGPAGSGFGGAPAPAFRGPAGSGFGSAPAPASQGPAFGGMRVPGGGGFRGGGGMGGRGR